MKFTLNTKTVLIVALLALSACGKDPNDSPPDAGPSSPGESSTPTPIVTPSPTPTPTVSPTPACKSLDSSWKTTDTPSSVLLGVYIGPPTNGPQYTFDLRSLVSGNNDMFSITYDASHSCYYNITLNASNYVVNSFEGCNLGIIPPGGTMNQQCDYCPQATAANPSNLNLQYNFSKSCSSLSITDPTNNHVLSYH